MTNIASLIVLLIFLGIAGLLIWLQCRLSRAKSRLPGLVLPVLHLIFTVIIMLSFAAYSFTGETLQTELIRTDEGDTVVVMNEDGEVLVAASMPEYAQETEDSAASIGIIGGADGPTSIFVTGSDDNLHLIPPFLLLNIPTAVYLLIYFTLRRNLSHAQTVNKTRIQDL